MRIAILGGGQLARMLGLAGYPLGFQFRCLDPSAEPCAGDLMESRQGQWDDPEALAWLLDGADCVTFETENVPVRALELIAASQCPCYPSAQALRVTQDRLLEKQALRAAGLATAPFAVPNSRDELPGVAEQLGFPLILKTRRLGYDGKGQRLVRSLSELEQAFHELGARDLIAEGFVAFEAEGSLLAVRAQDGTVAFYPVVRNHHVRGVLVQTELWDHFPESARRELESKMRILLDDFGYRGVLALEFFLAGAQVIANEMAPRVHNSGHWTLHAAQTSQFENHLRAITGLPLGPCTVPQRFRMLNLLGRVPPLSSILAVPGAKLCDYRKAPVPGRKVGHITLLESEGLSLDDEFARLVRLTEV